MAWSDTGRKNEAQIGGFGSLSVTLNSTVAGNFVVCGTSCYQGSALAMDPVVSDGGNTWTRSKTFQVPSETQAASISWSILTTGGNRTITSDPGTSTYDMSIYVHEFAGPHATPESGTPAGTGAASGTTADTTAMTPADNDVLVIAVEGHTSSGTITENVSPGDTGWTLSNDHEAGSGAEPGSMVFKIISGAPGTPRAAWTIPGTVWAAVIAAYKPAAAGAAAGLLIGGRLVNKGILQGRLVGT